MLVACAPYAHGKAFTLGDAEDRQGALARAKLDADIADAEAKTRVSTATGPLADGPNASKRPSDPAKDFTPYAFYQFGKRTCADVLHRGMLFTRCIGDVEPIDGWRLTSLTRQKAIFVKGGVQSTVPMGVAMGEAGADPVPPAAGQRVGAGS